MKELLKNIFLIILLLLNKRYNCQKISFKRNNKSSILRKLNNCYISCKYCNGNGQPINDILDFLWEHNCKECADGYYRLGGRYCFSNNTISEVIIYIGKMIIINGKNVIVSAELAIKKGIPII